MQTMLPTPKAAFYGINRADILELTSTSMYIFSDKKVCHFPCVNAMTGQLLLYLIVTT